VILYHCTEGERFLHSYMPDCYRHVDIVPVDRMPPSNEMELGHEMAVRAKPVALRSLYI